MNNPAAQLDPKRAALEALIEAQKASDAILHVLAGMEDRMHANGLSGGVWAIEAILQAMASLVDPVIDEWPADDNRREAAND